MRVLFNLSAVALLFILVRSADLAISAALGRSIVRAVAYGIVALLALIVVLIALVGV
jgi:hypothetical protein